MRRCSHADVELSVCDKQRNILERDDNGFSGRISINDRHNIIVYFGALRVNRTML